MGVLLVEVDATGLSLHQNRLVVANMVSVKGSLIVNQHLSPQIGVRPALVHGSVWFKIFLNEHFVLLKHHLDLLFII